MGQHRRSADCDESACTNHGTKHKSATRSEIEFSRSCRQISQCRNLMAAVDEILEMRQAREQFAALMRGIDDPMSIICHWLEPEPCRRVSRQSNKRVEFAAV